jgi:hypothetical protein
MSFEPVVHGHMLSTHEVRSLVELEKKQNRHPTAACLDKMRLSRLILWPAAAPSTWGAGYVTQPRLSSPPLGF